MVARLSKALKSEANEATADPEEPATVDQNASNGDTIEIADEQGNSNDGMDIDMADIVVIDEYDSTKVDHKSDESRKENGKMSERDRRCLERRYRLPDSPHILVHPTQPKSLDKFTCEVMSLSILLDYRPEDTKRHSFEVSLFAELFNEMLIRDFGFNIYKALFKMASDANHQKDPKQEEEEPKEKRQRKEENSTDVKSEKSTKKNVDENGEKTKSNEAEKNHREVKEERDRDRRERRTSRREEESEDETHSIRSNDKRKMVTVDPDLLLSFVYFDQTHCGYIFSNHLEELFYALGLRISRADTKRIVNQVAPRSLIYRKLTDKPKDEAKVESVDDPKKLVEIGKGNNIYLPIFSRGDLATLNDENVSIKQEPNESEKLETTEKPSMVMHKGAVIDIEKLLSQMQRSENAREEAERRVNELTQSQQELQTVIDKANGKIKELQSDLKSNNRKLNDALSSLSSSNVSEQLDFPAIFSNYLFFCFSFAEEMHRILFNFVQCS